MSELIDFFVQPGTVVCAGIAFVTWLYTEHLLKPHPVRDVVKQQPLECIKPEKKERLLHPQQSLYLNSLNTTAVPECIDPHGRGGSNRIAFAVRDEE